MRGNQLLKIALQNCCETLTTRLLCLFDTGTFCVINEAILKIQKYGNSNFQVFF